MLVKKLILFLAVSFLLCLVATSAIPYPGGTRCRLYGGELDAYNQSICILPGDIKCDPMGSDEDNWTGTCGEYAIMPCAELGTTSTENACCEGLTAIQKKDYFNSACVWNPPTGYTSICSNCGDDICHTDIENKCNCPSDCIKLGFFHRLHSWFANLFH